MGLRRCRICVVSVAVLLLLLPGAALAQSVVMLRDLTLSAESLPAECALTSAPSIHLDGDRVRYGLWAGYPANPWIGTDREQIISIREMIGPPTPVPDGPPLDARALSRFRGQLANGVEEAYGAVYMQSADLIIVRAIRFAPGKKIPAPDTHVSRDPRVIRVDIGQIVVIVTGTGECFQTIGTYLKSLAN